MVDLSTLRVLEKDAKVERGQRWIYSADFNVKAPLDVDKSYPRIDSEIPGIKFISDKGGIVIILAHKGRYNARLGESDEEDLEFVRDYLMNRLERNVNYFPDNVGETAIHFAQSLQAGEVAIFGNTRDNEGEETKDESKALALAKRYADLVGENGRVAVGGFGKAHRKNASNYYILEFLPGYITQSHLAAMQQLEPWTGKSTEPSLAVLGGIKKEKITVGLRGLAKNYDYIIPGGIVLNTGTRVTRREMEIVGGSVVEDGGKTFEKEMEAILRSDETKAKIFFPHQFLHAKKTGEGFSDISVADFYAGGRIPQDSMIVSYFLTKEAIEALEEVAQKNGRIVLAGIPDLYAKGFGLATNKILSVFNSVGKRGLILGEDTSAEIKYDAEKYGGTVSEGGGSALDYLVEGTTPVVEKLLENRERFG